MEAQWSHDDLFPIIAQAIDDLYAQSRRLVGHDAIAAFLLKDSEASNHIAAACEASETERSRDWVAHNMVAWFGQRITVGESKWSNRFERQKINGKWAYKPTTVAE
jgi:hypothetical protein